MQLITIAPKSTSLPTGAKPESVEHEWVPVLERLPDDGEPVHVMLAQSREIRIAWRGNYQSTGAWFDAETRHPIYETIDNWRAR
jgi:hypothetical protein